jgi:hypothetical protein
LPVPLDGIGKAVNSLNLKELRQPEKPTSHI